MLPARIAALPLGDNPSIARNSLQLQVDIHSLNTRSHFDQLTHEQQPDRRYTVHRAVQDRVLRLSVAIFDACTIHLTTLLHNCGHKHRRKLPANALRLASTLKAYHLRFPVQNSSKIRCTCFFCVHMETRYTPSYLGVINSCFGC